MKTADIKKAEEEIYSFKPKIYPRRKAKKKSPVVKTELSSEELSSLTECTGYSEEEIQAWFSQFQTVCPGGVLRRSKMVKMFEDLGKPKPADLVDNILTIFDGEGRGQLSFREFLAATHQSEIASPEIKLRWQFQLYDSDGSGYINQEEFVKIFLKIFDGENTGQTNTREEKEAVRGKAKDMFAELDDSGDGEVSQEEFIQGCMKDEELLRMLSEN